MSEKLSSWKHKFIPTTSSNVWKDPDGDLPLSDKQKKRFVKWLRPHEITNKQPPVMVRSINPYTIRQEYVTDCSFISSLIICAHYEKRFNKRLVTSIIYPQDSNGIPIYNPDGKYIVKLWLNGVARQVVVDDRLPCDKYSNLLCSHTTTSSGNNKQQQQLELWVPIIEKAYMKLCGGYDFPGSNSGVDMWSLTGYIPERIFFPQNPNKIRDFETAPDRAWERLYSANSFGDCLITVSTSKSLPEDEADSLGLVTCHSYAVLDVVQSSTGVKLLQLKNPWQRKSWKGKYSAYDKGSWKINGLKEEVGYDPDEAEKHDDGIFYIGWDDVLEYFNNLQLSWNPRLFAYRQCLHGLWPETQGPKDDSFNVGENPQYILQLSDQAVAKKPTVWVLLSRHVNKQEQEGEEVKDFLTIHLVRNSSKKERVWYPHGPRTLVNGAYTNNPHVLLRYDIEGPQDKYISLVLSQHEKTHDLGYTLSCYCTERFILTRPPKTLPWTTTVKGEWTADTAGGPVGSKKYFNNPMFAIKVVDGTTIQLQCNSSKTTAGKYKICVREGTFSHDKCSNMLLTCFVVNVMLISLGGKEYESLSRYRELAKSHGRPILDSGNYRHGFAVTETKSISGGTYAIQVSTYNAGKLGAFEITIASSAKIASYQPIP